MNDWGVGHCVVVSLGRAIKPWEPILSNMAGAAASQTKARWGGVERRCRVRVSSNIWVSTRNGNWCLEAQIVAVPGSLNLCGRHEEHDTVIIGYGDTVWELQECHKKRFWICHNKKFVTICRNSRLSLYKKLSLQPTIVKAAGEADNYCSFVKVRRQIKADLNQECCWHWQETTNIHPSVVCLLVSLLSSPIYCLRKLETTRVQTGVP